MTCSAILRVHGKLAPRTCEIHGLGPCPETTQENEGLDWIQRYANAKGWVDRQWIVNEILQHEDGDDNAVHRVLTEASRFLNKDN